MASILICDDERNLRDLLAMSLENVGHAVTTTPDLVSARAALDKGLWDLLITDLRLPDGSGLDLLRHAKELNPATQVLLITAYASTETAVTAMKEGAFEYLEKPFHMEDLLLVATRALERSQLHSENQRLRQELREREGLAELVGQAPAMRRVLELARRVARTDTTVLINGESGTGKELAARAIHRFSPRNEGPFVAINCGAIPENLMESELFGHTKGAFSGAVGSRKGVFVEADGGTLLLDEIGEMPLSTQVKLLRVLQERTVRPVGGEGERPVDVRVLATTHRDLTREIGDGRFREDLYYRINVVNLMMPPLRERREDIPLLAMHFLQKCAQRHGLGVRGFSRGALERLREYHFPGNVRELENLIEGAASLSLGDTLDDDALPAHVRAPGHSNPAPCAENLWPLEQEGVHLESLLESFETRWIQEALNRAGGNKTRAAELLGLSFRSFRYRLAKLGLGREEE